MVTHHVIGYGKMPSYYIMCVFEMDVLVAWKSNLGWFDTQLLGPKEKELNFEHAIWILRMGHGFPRDVIHATFIIPLQECIQSY